jgi:hypothetical protein
MTNFLPNDVLDKADDGDYEPRHLLDQVAAEVLEKTDNQLYGEVRTRYPYGQKVEHQFYFVAGAAQRYSYLLFSVSHTIDEYPLTIDGPGQGERHECSNRAEFESVLRTIFHSSRTHKLINQLVKSISGA